MSSSREFLNASNQRVFSFSSFFIGYLKSGWTENSSLFVAIHPPLYRIVIRSCSSTISPPTAAESFRLSQLVFFLFFLPTLLSVLEDTTDTVSAHGDTKKKQLDTLSVLKIKSAIEVKLENATLREIVKKKKVDISVAHVNRLN